MDDPAPVIEPPRARTRKTPRATRTNFEMYGWLFMRLSGVLLVVLVLGHLLIQLVLDGGVTKIGFAFVAGRWASLFWQAWGSDHALARHAARRERPAHDHQRLRGAGQHPPVAEGRCSTRRQVFTIVLGTLVIFTFDPNIR
ncbi:Succinate dehydrogenase OS=Streptomyces antimycoticus OX=68175 GN=SANT12839_043070 PE=4 SV=1 [Streptomyces antimycoticus]